jgi:DNA polymerase I-like protein with 3'-5' exonuclease and polymerase domains
VWSVPSPKSEYRTIRLGNFVPIKENYLVLDFEFNCRRDKRIVAMGLNTKTYQESYYFKKNQEFNANLGYILKDIELIVAHHSPADLLRIWHKDAFQSWLLAGGKIWDTSVIEYLLTAQDHTYPALRDIAVNKYGCAERTKWIEKLLFDLPKKEQENLDIEDLPPEKVLEDVTNDVLDTAKVFFMQYTEVEKFKLFPFIYGQMDAVLATTEMTYNGWKIDKNVLESNQQNLERQLAEEHKKLHRLIKPLWHD